jgi:hypothetical protein
MLILYSGSNSCAMWQSEVSREVNRLWFETAEMDGRVYCCPYGPQSRVRSYCFAALINISKWNKHIWTTVIASFARLYETCIFQAFKRHERECDEEWTRDEAAPLGCDVDVIVVKYITCFEAYALHFIFVQLYIQVFIYILHDWWAARLLQRGRPAHSANEVVLGSSSTQGFPIAKFTVLYSHFSANNYSSRN